MWNFRPLKMTQETTKASKDKLNKQKKSEKT